jgi:hypothetical protein
MNRMTELVELAKQLRKDATTQGVSTQTGLNFYYLEPQAKNIYPVFYPLLASIPRVQPMLNGMVVGGTGVNWKAIISIDSGGPQSAYTMISEGNRNAFMYLQEKDYFAAYKYFGKDGEASFQAQQTGLGFDDIIGLEQISLLNALLNGEEKEILYGNSGSSGNGYQLGQTGTPVYASTTTTGGTIPASTNCSVFCIALTPMGASMFGLSANGGGVQPPFVRTNADGSQDLINGGTAALSAGSAVTAVGGGTSTNTITFTVPTGFGDVAYAWYLDSTDAATANPANAYLVGITYVPTITITAIPSTGGQKASTAGLTTDNSANQLDIDGLFTWNVNYAQAAQPSYYKNLAGANLTANGDGTIAEFETVMDYAWTNYKATYDRIWVGGTLIDSVTKKILAAGVNNAVTRMYFQTDGAGRIIGGTNAVVYRSKYGPGQSKQLEIITHPWMPQGMIYFDTINNPYPAAGNAIPAVRRMVCLEDHFSIKWPYRRLQHEIGTYCFAALTHYLPFITASLVCAGTS